MRIMYEIYVFLLVKWVRLGFFYSRTILSTKGNVLWITLHIMFSSLKNAIYMPKILNFEYVTEK